MAYRGIDSGANLAVYSADIAGDLWENIGEGWNAVITYLKEERTEAALEQLRQRIANLESNQEVENEVATTIGNISRQIKEQQNRITTLEENDEQQNRIDQKLGEMAIRLARKKGGTGHGFWNGVGSFFGALLGTVGAEVYGKGASIAENITEAIDNISGVAKATTNQINQAEAASKKIIDHASDTAKPKDWGKIKKINENRKRKKAQSDKDTSGEGSNEQGNNQESDTEQTNNVEEESDEEETDEPPEKKQKKDNTDLRSHLRYLQ